MRFWLVWFFLALTSPALAETPARIGIFGTVESTAPLIVAGQHIEMPANLRVISVLGPGQEITSNDTLAIVASLEAGRMVATRVLEVYPVIGPVSEVSGNTATIMGTDVHVPPDVMVRAGSTLAISGLWSGQKAITSNVRPVEGRFAQITGVVDARTVTLGGSLVLSGVTPEGGFGQGVWMLSGAAEAQGLRVRLMSQGLFGGPVDLVWWQGYASGPIASQTYMIYGAGIIGTAHDAQMPAAGSLIARCAREGRVVEKAPMGLEEAFHALNCARHIPAD